MTEKTATQIAAEKYARQFRAREDAEYIIDLISGQIGSAHRTDAILALADAFYTRQLKLEIIK